MGRALSILSNRKGGSDGKRGNRLLVPGVTLEPRDARERERETKIAVPSISQGKMSPSSEIRQINQVLFASHGTFGVVDLVAPWTLKSGLMQLGANAR